MSKDADSNDDYGFIGKAMRAIGKHRERIGAKAQKQENMEADKDNATSKSESYAEERQNRIDNEIRARRKARKEAES